MVALARVEGTRPSFGSGTGRGVVDKAMGLWIPGRHRPPNLDWTVQMACGAVVSFSFRSWAGII